MKTYTKEELSIILENHRKWLCGELDGFKANLSWANLSWADLSWANLSRANLSWADLSWANLSRANLSGANLSRAKLEVDKIIHQFSIVPPEGEFVCYKAVYDKYTKSKVVLKLEVQGDSKRIGGLIGRKCRASKVKVVDIVDGVGTVLLSGQDKNFEYKIGEIIEITNFDDDPKNECTTGIHFFLTKEEAKEFTHIGW